MHSVFRNNSENNWGYTVMKDEVTEDSSGGGCDNQSESERENRLERLIKNHYFILYTNNSFVN
jgi:hypothetical protein